MQITCAGDACQIVQEGLYFGQSAKIHPPTRFTPSSRFSCRAFFRDVKKCRGLLACGRRQRVHDRHREDDMGGSGSCAWNERRRRPCSQNRARKELVCCMRSDRRPLFESAIVLLAGGTNTTSTCWHWRRSMLARAQTRWRALSRLPASPPRRRCSASKAAMAPKCPSTLRCDVVARSSQRLAHGQQRLVRWHLPKRPPSRAVSRQPPLWALHLR